jgi:hypothetical protein
MDNNYTCLMIYCFKEGSHTSGIIRQPGMLTGQHHWHFGSAPLVSSVSRGCHHPGQQLLSPAMHSVVLRAPLPGDVRVVDFVLVSATCHIIRHHDVWVWDSKHQANLTFNWHLSVAWPISNSDISCFLLHV